MNNKLDARIARLEKILKNEGYDISADVYNWFNKYCSDLLDKDDNDIKDLKYDLEDTDASVYADECLLDLAAEQGVDPEDMEDYRDQVEYDIEKLVKDALEYIEDGYDSGMIAFDKNKADWMDRYRDNVDYTASLESRINKLEKSLKHENLEDINDVQMEYIRNVSFLADKMITAAADIEEQAEASGDEKLRSYVFKAMVALNLVRFYLKRKLH